jgi:hypothetical protein
MEDRTEFIEIEVKVGGELFCPALEHELRSFGYGLEGWFLLPEG